MSELQNQLVRSPRERLPSLASLSHLPGGTDDGLSKVCDTEFALHAVVLLVRSAFSDRLEGNLAGGFATAEYFRNCPQQRDGHGPFRTR
jgi:hypothetical protein